MNETKHAVLSFIQRDGAILSAWNRTYLCWGLVGGKVEPGEGFEAALRREMWEEARLVPKKIWHPEIDTHPTFSGSGRLCHTYEVEIGNAAEPRLVEVGTGLAWMSPDFLKQEPKTGAWFRRLFDMPYFKDCWWLT